MLPRLYLMAGSLLVVGYAICSMAGWEFGNAIRVTPAPPRGAAIVVSAWGWGGRSSTYYGSSSTYRGSSIPSGPTGGK